MPAKDRRWLDEEGHALPCGRESGCDAHDHALPRRPSHAADDLSLCDDQLLSEHRVLRQAGATRSEEIGEEAANEPEEVDHGLVVLRFRVRMANVAITASPTTAPIVFLVLSPVANASVARQGCLRADTCPSGGGGERHRASRS